MGCTYFSGGVVCTLSGTYARRVMDCPTCEKRRRFSGQVAIWYDTVWTCCGCGDAWDGGFGSRMERPFARGWREEAKRRARQGWDQGVSLSKAYELLDAEASLYFGADDYDEELDLAS